MWKPVTQGSRGETNGGREEPRDGCATAPAVLSGCREGNGIREHRHDTRHDARRCPPPRKTQPRPIPDRRFSLFGTIDSSRPPVYQLNRNRSRRGRNRFNLDSSVEIRFRPQRTQRSQRKQSEPGRRTALRNKTDFHHLGSHFCYRVCVRGAKILCA